MGRNNAHTRAAHGLQAEPATGITHTDSICKAYEEANRGRLYANGVQVRHHRFFQRKNKACGTQTAAFL